MQTMWLYLETGTVEVKLYTRHRLQTNERTGSRKTEHLPTSPVNCCPKKNKKIKKSTPGGTWAPEIKHRVRSSLYDIAYFVIGLKAHIKLNIWPVLWEYGLKQSKVKKYTTKVHQLMCHLMLMTLKVTDWLWSKSILVLSRLYIGQATV